MEILAFIRRLTATAIVGTAILPSYRNGTGRGCAQCYADGFSQQATHEVYAVTPGKRYADTGRTAVFFCNGHMGEAYDALDRANLPVY